VPEQLLDTETEAKKDLKRLEESLHILWDKARLVSDELLNLKAKNRELQNRLSGLEDDGRRKEEELRRQQKDLLEMREQLDHAQSNGSGLFSKEELDAVKLRLKELISTINSRL
jgi:predicted  nucleic acid-binding Zn-ribbon protein